MSGGRWSPQRDQYWEYDCSSQVIYAPLPASHDDDNEKNIEISKIYHLKAGIRFLTIFEQAG